MANYQPESPSLETANSAAALDAVRRVRTSMPGRVVSFDPVMQTAVVEAMVHQVLSDGGAAALPPLLDVPVAFPRAGGFVITFPVKPGDEGLVSLSDRCIDGWWQSGKAGPPLTYRMHDLSDAFFAPGICSLPNVVPDFKMDALVVRSLAGDAYVKLGEDRRIEIDGLELRVNCPAVFKELVTYQNGIAGNGGGNGNRLQGGLQMEGGEVTHDGKNIGGNHRHGGVKQGGDNSGGPA